MAEREDALRAQCGELFAKCVNAAEKREANTLTDSLGPNFQGPGSTLDEVKSMIVGQLFRNDNSMVVVSPQL